MAGILDYLTGNDAGASPWGALYQQQGPSPEEIAKKQANIQQADFLRAISQNPAEGLGNPNTDPSGTSPVFGPVPQIAPQAPPAPPTGFGAGAAPFGFAGPGSMSGISPAMMAGVPAPAPAPAPQAAQPQPASPAPTDVSSVNRTAPAAPEQASPIAVGNYMMPRVGSADSYEPDDTTPANARPTQGAAPAQVAGSPAPLSLGGAASGIGDRLGMAARGFMGNLGAGPIGALMAGTGSLLMGRESDPTAIAQGKMNATAQALLKKGVEPAVVQAAMSNPEVLKSLIPQYFGPDKFQHVTVKNADGSESPQAFDPSTGKYSGAAPQAPSKFSVDPTLTGKDRLDALRAVDPLYARKIESMVSGDLPMPTGVAALRPDAKRMIEDALAVDGSTSASDFQTRASTRKDYASGIASRVTKSINTTIGHFATLDDSIGKLGNYSYFPKLSNTVHDMYSSNLDPKYQAAKATFETNKEAAVKELDFALSGGHSSVSGSAELRDKFNRADSPEALHAAITEAMSLLQKRLESHTKAFTEGTKSQRDPQDFIYPENQQAFSRLLGQSPGATAAPQQGIPKPGNYVWTPSGGLSGVK